MNNYWVLFKGNEYIGQIVATLDTVLNLRGVSAVLNGDYPGLPWRFRKEQLRSVLPQEVVSS